MSGGPTVGLLRSLYAYHFEPYWATLFASLGLRTRVVSLAPDALAARASAFEGGLCLPVKYFLAQASALAEEGVEVLFAPLVASVDGLTYSCPKVLMTPDLLRLYGGGAVTLVSPLVEPSPETGLLPALEAAARAVAAEADLGADRVDGAVAAAAGAFAACRGRVHAPWSSFARVPAAPEGRRPRVLILGHRYAVHDPLLSHNLPARLASLGLRPMTREDLGPAPAPGSASDAAFFADRATFAEGPDILAAAAAARESADVDGVIYLAMFNCGFDAVLEDVIARRILGGSGLPYLHLVTDEHASHANLGTRLEVFADVLHEAAAREAR